MGTTLSGATPASNAEAASLRAGFARLGRGSAVDAVVPDAAKAMPYDKFMA